MRETREITEERKEARERERARKKKTRERHNIAREAIRDQLILTLFVWLSTVYRIKLGTCRFLDENLFNCLTAIFVMSTSVPRLDFLAAL